MRRDYALVVYRGRPAYAFAALLWSGLVVIRAMLWVAVQLTPVAAGVVTWFLYARLNIRAPYRFVNPHEVTGMFVDSGALLFGLGMTIIFGSALRGRTVHLWTTLTLALGAMSTYIAIFSSIYYVYGSKASNFLVGPGASRPSRVDAAYFAMTTFTTTGYGDWRPESQRARLIVTIQQATGFLLLSVFLVLLLSRIRSGGRLTLFEVPNIHDLVPGRYARLTRWNRDPPTSSRETLTAIVDYLKDKGDSV